MPAWLVTLGNGRRHHAAEGTLEATLLWLRATFGTDEFAVEAESLAPGAYVPELERPEVPDTIPEEWGG